MGANAQTSVPTFTAGEVLTAANMNISARTGVPVFANTTARDAGFGGTGEKTLAEGQLCYLEDSNVVQYYDGSTWATVGPTTVSSGLTVVKTQVIGSGVSSVAVTSAFSSSYDSYIITLTGGASSGTGWLTFQLGATTTGYYYAGSRLEYNNTVNNNSGSNAANWGIMGGRNANSLSLYMQINSPFLTEETTFQAQVTAVATGGSSGTATGWLNNTTSYTDFTLAPDAGTLTGGTIRVYGLANS